MFNATEAYQIFKLPTLVQHFIEHKKEDSKITFYKFLKIHYLDPVKYDADYAQDKQLPFKDHSEDYCFWIVPTLPVQKFELQKIDFPIATVKTISNYSCNYSYLSLHDIFQPPRVS